MRVIVCGGRDFADEGLVARTLDALVDRYGSIVVIHGAAKGADTLAARWALAAESSNRCDGLRAFPADWTRYGRRAGPIRNVEMLHVGKPQLVVAFPGGRGTAHMIRIAKAAGVNVLEVGV